MKEPLCLRLGIRDAQVPALEAEITRLRAALEAEKERCAKVADMSAAKDRVANERLEQANADGDARMSVVEVGNDCIATAESIAAAIRALPSPPEAP